MAERDLIQQLDQAVSALLAGAADAATGPEVKELMRIATAARDLPDQEFRSRLKRDVIIRATKERETMTTLAVTPTTTSPEAWMPEGFRSLTPYLLAPSSAKLLDFLKEALGATELLRVPRPDGSIMHAEVRIGDSRLEMGENPPDEYSARPTPLHVYVPDVDAVYARAIAAGATSMGEPRDHEYGERGANVRDAAGNHWYLATARGASYVPEGLHSVNISLHLNGAPGFIDFLKRAFGANEAMRHEAPEGNVVHAAIKIGDSILEMSEAHGEWQPMPCAIHLYVPDTDAVYRQAIDAGAVSISAPVNAEYGDRYAAVRDPQGNQWFIATRLRNAG